MATQNASLDLNILSRYMPGAYLWKKDLHSNYLDINAECANLFGIKNIKQVLNMNDYDIPCKISELAHLFQQQDQFVIQSKKPLKILEIHPAASGEWKIMLNTKNPLLDSQDKIVGTFAYCIDITHHSDIINNLISSCIGLPHKKNNLVQGSFKIGVDSQSERHLTRREMECLYYFIRGKTTKEIAKILALSPRTIEQFLLYLKQKFKAHSKAELIQKAIHEGYLNIIPESFFTLHLSEILIGNT